MTTKVSANGQVVLPGSLCRKLGICAGDLLEVKIEAGRIVLIPRKRRVYKAKIVKDPISGFPVLSVDPGAPVLTSREVRKMLANFP